MICAPWKSCANRKWATWNNVQQLLVYRHTSVTQIPASKVCRCGCSIQIHTGYRNPAEEKGLRGRSPSQRAGPEAPPPPTPGQAFIVFLGPLHQRRSYYAKVCFGWLSLQTQERVLLNTSKEDICNVKGGYLQCKGRNGPNGFVPYLEGLAQILGR